MDALFVPWSQPRFSHRLNHTFLDVLSPSPDYMFPPLAITSESQQDATCSHIYPPSLFVHFNEAILNKHWIENLHANETANLFGAWNYKINAKNENTFLGRSNNHLVRLFCNIRQISKRQIFVVFSTFHKSSRHVLAEHKDALVNEGQFHYYRYLTWSPFTAFWPPLFSSDKGQQWKQGLNFPEKW